MFIAKPLPKSWNKPSACLHIKGKGLNINCLQSLWISTPTIKTPTTNVSAFTEKQVSSPPTDYMESQSFQFCYFGTQLVHKILHLKISLGCIFLKNTGVFIKLCSLQHDASLTLYIPLPSKERTVLKVCLYIWKYNSGNN